MISVLINKQYIDENISKLKDINVDPTSFGFSSSTKLLSVEVLEDTQFVVDLLDVHDISIDFLFNKSNVNAHVIGVYSLHSDQKITSVIRAVHNTSDTTCLIDVKGVLKDSSNSFHLSEIYIDKKAFNTESFLNDHALLLGEKSKTIAMPNLRIHNNQVKASHGASIGSINIEKLYYLQSRGFDKKEATEMLITGFLESTFNEINDQNMANQLRHKLLTLAL